MSFEWIYIVMAMYQNFRKGTKFFLYEIKMIVKILGISIINLFANCIFFKYGNVPLKY